MVAGWVDRGTVREAPGPVLAWAAAEAQVAGPVVAVERVQVALAGVEPVQAAVAAYGNRAECLVAEAVAV